jgi:hypothetical protein
MDVDSAVAAATEFEDAVRVSVRTETIRRALGRLGILADDFRVGAAELSKATPDAALRQDLSSVKLFRDTRASS